MNEDFIRERITALRLKKGVSEYKMSYDLGHSRSYIYNISSGKCLPPMSEFLEICRYLEVTPMEFFDTSVKNPALFKMVTDEIKKLSEDDLMLILGVIRRLTK